MRGARPRRLCAVLPARPGVVRRPVSRSGAVARLAVGLVLGLALLLAGCAAPVRPDQPADSPSPVVIAIPSDGISLRKIGFVNGPSGAFSLPRTVVITTAVDEPTGVTVVLGNPSASELAAYLRRALPKTGFVITADNQATASLTFTGYGWHGSFTGTGDSSAVILRP